jgi:hypothetical protein
MHRARFSEIMVNDGTLNRCPGFEFRAIALASLDQNLFECRFKIIRSDDLLTCSHHAGRHSGACPGFAAMLVERRGCYLFHDVECFYPDPEIRSLTIQRSRQGISIQQQQGMEGAEPVLQRQHGSRENEARHLPGRGIYAENSSAALRPFGLRMSADEIIRDSVAPLVNESTLCTMELRSLQQVFETNFVVTSDLADRNKDLNERILVLEGRLAKLKREIRSETQKIQQGQGPAVQHAPGRQSTSPCHPVVSSGSSQHASHSQRMQDRRIDEGPSGINPPFQHGSGEDVAVDHHSPHSYEAPESLSAQVHRQITCLESILHRVERSLSEVNVQLTNGRTILCTMPAKQGRKDVLRRQHWSQGPSESLSIDLSRRIRNDPTIEASMSFVLSATDISSGANHDDGNKSHDDNRWTLMAELDMVQEEKRALEEKLRAMERERVLAGSNGSSVTLLGMSQFSESTKAIQKVDVMRSSMKEQAANGTEGKSIWNPGVESAVILSFSSSLDGLIAANLSLEGETSDLYRNREISSMMTERIMESMEVTLNSLKTCLGSKNKVRNVTRIFDCQRVTETFRLK